jgi:acetyltransferase-like isoleucine patch superfamily enzyme
VYKLDRVGYLARVLAHNPSELLRLAGIGLTTAKFRWIKRCAGPGSVMGLRTRIVNSANVRIGSKVFFQDDVYLRAGTEGRIVIGDRCAINSFAKFFGHGGITLGEDTQIGPGTLITTTGHDYRAGLETSFKAVTIGRRVWVGANVTILPGVQVGDHAVIGAGSVVHRNIPPYSVAVGVPARVIRRIEPDTEEAAAAAAGGGGAP